MRPPLSKPTSHTSTSIDGAIRSIRKSEPAVASDADIAAIGEAVLAGTHPYLNWTHLAHCATTIYFLVQYPKWDLEHCLPDIIRNYNTAIGVTNSDKSGYHQTLTIFYIRALRKFLETDLGMSETMEKLQRSPLAIREYVLNYYSREHLFTPEARSNWVEPDLKPLPF